MAKHAHEIVILCQAPSRCAQLTVGGCTAHCFSEYSEFLESEIRPQAFVIKGDDEAYTHERLYQLRRDPDHATALVFLDGPASEADQAASDGPLPSNSTTLVGQLEQRRSRQRAIRFKNDSRAPDALLLEHMWLRPDFVLKPLADWRHPRRYAYPLIEALDRSDSDPDSWLARLDKGGLIERVTLCDRQRECDYCGSAHLNFIDVCPNCRSIEIGEHTALHCFTCGLIAPEGRFVRADQRQCPKCGTRLRHIGSDYDRPLETNLCGACDHVFVEGDVEARCAICKRSAPSTKLRLRKIYSWRLSGMGCLAAQGGAPQPAADAFDSRQYLAYPQFVNSLAWSLKLAGEGFSFVLAGLQLDNLDQLNKTFGAARTGELLQACSERLREALGETDLAARIDQEVTVLLLPNADRRRLDALHRTLQELVKQAMQENRVGPNWRLAEHQVHARNASGEEAERLLQRLRESLNTRGADKQVA